MLRRGRSRVKAMEGNISSGISGDIAAAFAWWRDAGIDCDFAEAPQQWLAREEAATGSSPQAAMQRAAPPPPPARVHEDKSTWPADLAAFRDWWMSQPALDKAPPAERVPPRGPAQAAVMVIVEQPEAMDSSELLSGSSGALLRSMLAAMGLAPGSVYLGSALPRHTPLADWQAAQSAGLGEVLIHHVRLVAPQRVILLGANIPPLIGHDPAQSAQTLDHFNHEGRTIPVLAAPGLDALVRPRAKAQFWSRWLDWTETGSA